MNNRKPNHERKKKDFIDSKVREGYGHKKYELFNLGVPLQYNMLKSFNQNAIKYFNTIKYSNIKLDLIILGGIILFILAPPVQLINN